MKRVGLCIVAMLWAYSGALAADEFVFVEKGNARGVREIGHKWTCQEGALTCSGEGNYLIAGKAVGVGDFQIRARLSLARLDGTAASLMIGGNHFGFDGRGEKFFVEGPALGQTRLLGDVRQVITPGEPFDLEVTRKGATLSLHIDGKEIYSAPHKLAPVCAIGFRPWRATMRLHHFSASGSITPATEAAIKTLWQSHLAAQTTRFNSTRIGKAELTALRMAIEDLRRSSPHKYQRGAEFLTRLTRIEEQAGEGPDEELSEQQRSDFIALKREALAANPLLDFERLLMIRRRIGREANQFSKDWKFNYRTVGIPDTGSGNTILPRKGFDNEIAVLSSVRDIGTATTLHRPNSDVFVGDIDLHWDAEKMLFSSLDANGRWQIFELGTDGRNLRQVTPGLYSDVDNYDACYLPDGGIVFGSTRSFQRVPCRSTMQTPITLLYRMNAEGTDIRQLTFDQDHNWCPTVLSNGRIMYLRWEYSGIPHGASRVLFQMNPDGTGQAAYYGSNSHWPNGVFFARPVPGHSGMFTGVISGNHDVPRMGEMILFDRNKGTFEADGVVQRLPGRGKKVIPIIQDAIVADSWPKFLHPYPLSDKYFLTACKPTPTSLWGIYLVDVFDNLLLLREEPGSALLEPIPLLKTPRPPVIPSGVAPHRKDALVHLADVYQGKGLAGVPRGTVKQLRLFTYHFQYIDMLPSIRNSVGGDGPWEPLRVLGTVPVEADGSASFRVPANTPISVQPLDEKGAALQLMRSWFTAMPGETVSCVGCHESPSETPSVAVSMAAKRTPSEITPWYGPTRGFSFEREVQPVLQKYCVGCHDGKPREDGKRPPDLRQVQGTGAIGEYSPSYRTLYAYTRTPSLESDMHMLVPGDFHADNSELVRMLRGGHHGVKLPSEAWDRLTTWIDLCVPYYGTWHELAGPKTVTRGSDRRRAMRKLYAGIDEDPEAVPAQATPAPVPIIPEIQAVGAKPPTPAGWPFDAEEARRRQSVARKIQRDILLGDGVPLTLVYIPAGHFVMGDEAGSDDERPLTPVRIDKPFWIGKLEVTNQQLAQFDAQHDSRWVKGPGLQYTDADRGWRVNGPRQPVVRISWQRAMEFCRWLSEKTGETYTLPSEAQWEYACRAGTATPLSYGGPDVDFSEMANVADRTLIEACFALRRKSLPRTTPTLQTLVRPAFSDMGNDGTIVSADVGQYLPNAWGLHDMHGNAAEWTRSTYRPYPYRADDGRDDPTTDSRKVVRGGSFHDRPVSCRSACRVSYPSWRRVFNVGFRVICPITDPSSSDNGLSSPLRATVGSAVPARPVPSAKP